MDSELKTVDTTPPGPAKKHAFFTPLFVDITAAFSSLAAAAATAWTQIEAKAYANISAFHAFEKMKDVRHERFHDEVYEPHLVEQLDKDTAYRQAREIVQQGTSGAGEMAEAGHFVQSIEKASLGAERGAKQALDAASRYKNSQALVHWNEGEGRRIMREVVGADTLLKRWGLLRSHQKIETVIFAGAAAGLSLVAVLPLARSFLNNEQKDELAKKSGEQSPSR